MPSPPRTLRRSPPRRALHERSESHANELSVRPLGDSKAPVYQSSPFPTQASQVLSPNGRGAEWLLEDEADVSDDDGPRQMLTPAPLHITKDNVGRDVALASGLGIGVQSNRTSIPDAPDPVENKWPSPSDAQYEPMVGARHHSARPVSDEIIELPSIPPIVSRDGSTVTSQSPPSGLGSEDAPSRGLLPSKISDNSLSSTESSATVIRKPTDRSSRPFYSAFPPTSSSRPSSSTSYQAPWTPPKPIVNSPTEPYSPASSASFTPQDRRTSSTASHVSLQEVTNSGADVQYPVRRPPAFSASRAESSETVPKRSIRLGSRNSLQKWNPHLSTVQSEYSDDRSSASLHNQSSAVPGNMSSMLVGEPSHNPNVPGPPVPAWGSQPVGSGLTVRVVGNQDVTLPDQSVPRLGSSGSAFFSPVSRDPNRGTLRDGSPTRPATRGSFLGIPAWARTYYARPPRDSISIPPGSSSANTASRSQSRVSRPDGNPALGIFRPRTRQREDDTAPPTRDSMAITPVVVADDTPVEVRGPASRKVTGEWSPHLWHDRRARARRSIFKAPSIDEEAEGSGLSRRTVQIWLFAGGFIFPLAWIVASVLPLPPKPMLREEQPQTRTRSKAERDLEKAMLSLDEARYENARWWRNINRIMSVLGLFVIGAVIALAVVAVCVRS
ncbi:hypothetical protein LPUS_05103 [Lasallia pustulata]|uniref:Serine-rich protein n=1 Tax=Lasallia pustulata TaxID=136370 RepID=A0A1W5CXZ7_9LECA|nr:hypothetical protein LPUS_05103 [Lasallia pustulata]